ncbi:hypothetical protein A2U01_0042292 [Trifolium medium]|uniref:Uncharacterized protein n=1 Tax=Trifolium medium TaxID=97028 RepID=A0A392QAG5_9FABA|nr:hypothetical protein [Trifolium medium]
MRWNGEIHVWSWQWCEVLSISDEQQLIALKELLTAFTLQSDMALGVGFRWSLLC